MSTSPAWFNWDGRAAVVTSSVAAEVLTEDGWEPVVAADVELDGRKLSEAAAREAFADELAAFGDPPSISRQDGAA